MLHQLKVDPRRIFLLDGCGAIVTILFLRIVLVKMHSVVGIPISTLNILASLPICFLMIDLVGYVFFEKVGVVVLKLIIGLNLCYCILSIYLGIQDCAVITWVGWLYLSVEIFVILGVVILERRLLAILPKPLASE